MSTTSLSYREQLLKTYWILDDLVTTLHYMAFDIGKVEKWPDLKENPKQGDEMPVSLEYLRKVNKKSADGILVMIKIASMAVRSLCNSNQLSQEELTQSLFSNNIRGKAEERKCTCETKRRKWACKISYDLGQLFFSTADFSKIVGQEANIEALDLEGLSGSLDLNNCIENLLCIMETHNKLSKAFIKYGFADWLSLK